MFIRRTFTWGEDEVIGETGFIPDGIEGAFAASAGRLIAHDALEHLPNPGGKRSPQEDELIALGAAWWLRGEPGRVENVYMAPDENWAHSVGGVINDQSYNGSIGRAPNTHQDIYGDHLDWIALRGVAIACYDQGFRNVIRDCSFRELVRRCENWMRLGYRRAAKRFHNNSYAAYDLYKEVETQVDLLLKRRCYVDGDKLIVSVSPKQGKALVRVKRQRYV